jgi:hypothetical protein
MRRASVLHRLPSQTVTLPSSPRGHATRAYRDGFLPHKKGEA